MTRLFACLLCIFVGVLPACQVVTSGPLYSPDTLTTDPRIEGVWVRTTDENTGSREYLTVQPAAWGQYRLTVEFCSSAPSPVEPFNLRGTMVALGGREFLDVELPPEELASLGWRALFVLPLHFVYRLELDGDCLCTSTLESGWFDEWSRAHPAAISSWTPPLSLTARAVSDASETDAPNAGSMSIPPVLVLNAPTSTLQGFFRDHASDPKAWIHPDRYTLFQSLDPRPNEK